MLLNVSGFYLKRPYVFERMVQSAFFLYACMSAEKKKCRCSLLAKGCTGTSG